MPWKNCPVSLAIRHVLGKFAVLACGWRLLVNGFALLRITMQT